MTETAGAAADQTSTRRWVVGVDGSESSQHAALWAAAHAPERTSELHLLTTWNIPTTAAMDPLSSVTTTATFDALEQGAGSIVDDVARQICPIRGVEVTQRVGRGSAAALLLDEAQHSDLLVVGSRGLGGFARLLLGSTSTQCATHSTVPVAVIPAKASIEQATSMLVAFDGSSNSNAALHWAVGFARAGATIDCVSVWDPMPIDTGADYVFLPEESGLARDRLDQCFADAVRSVTRTDIEITHRFVEGRTRTVLAERADESDLVVMGARGHGAIGAAILGSVSTWLLHHVERPIVVVPHAHDDD